jgi:hypothetical protein
MTHFEDYDLAQIVHRELQQLRSRPRSGTAEIDAIAAESAIPVNWQPRSSRAKVDTARNNTWLAIKELVETTAPNEGDPCE